MNIAHHDDPSNHDLPSSSSLPSTSLSAENLRSFLCTVHKSSSKHITCSKVALRVDDSGIVILEAKRGTLLAKYVFEDIVSWASSSGTFAFETSIGIPTKSAAKKEQNLRLLFLTKEGVAIAEAMNRAVAKIVAEEEKKFEQEEKRYREELEQLESESRKAVEGIE